MRLSVYALFTLKDLDDKYTGATSEGWNFGKSKAIKFDDLVIAFADKALNFYEIFTDKEELERACKQLALVFSKVEFKEVK